MWNCTINADGSLGACTQNFLGVPINTLAGVAVTATNAYLVDYVGENLTTCTVSAADGTLSGCTQQTLDGTDALNTPGSTSPRSTNVYGGNLYVGTNAGTLILPIAGGSVTVTYPCLTAVGTSCTIEYAPVQTAVYGFAFNNGYAYASGFGGGGGIGICTITAATGILANCATSPTLPGPTDYGGLAVH